MASSWSFAGLGWRELARRVGRQALAHDTISRSAQLSYFFLFSLFPLLVFLTSLLGLFSDSGVELRDELLGHLRAVVPAKAHALIRDTLDEIISASSGGKVSFGLLVALWTASFGMSAVVTSLNEAYGVRESRPWWKAQLVALALTVTLVVLIMSALALLLYGHSIGLLLADRLGLGATFTTVWAVLQLPFVLAFVLLAFALIYYFAPDVQQIKWQWITPGSVLGLGLWLAVSFAFRLYIHFFDTYSTTYGSLGAVMILLLWLYLTGAAILVGGELNAIIEHAAAEAGAPDAKEHGEVAPGVPDDTPTDDTPHDGPGD
ncbi:MAG TPA: YihY/virulence factor BrkB family protein [Pyrinomonadaceae bacterium]|nr:YihY/virulence factor BrkB family protein [Pyrinomonadaceae bacterium]